MRIEDHYGWPLVVACIVAVAVTVSACELDVTNPGPMQDEFLNNEGAHDAVVEGMSARLSQALWRVSFIGAGAAKEFTQGGRIHPIKLPVDPGQLTVDGIQDTHWDFAQSARWVAEDGVRRFRDAKEGEFSEYRPGAEALIYAGFTNRIAGENLCEAVIDGGPAEPNSVFFERAEDHFTEALQIAENLGDAELRNTALAGRAQVRLHLEKWDDAVSDAVQVPEDFEFEAIYSGDQEDHYNHIFYLNENDPFRAFSVIDTYYEDYYEDTGDPRVSWDTDPEVPTAEFEDVPWLFPTKFESRGDNVHLATGREMRLIEAEVELRDGNWQEALDIINDLRSSVISDHTGDPIPEWEAQNEEETWTRLKRERGIELWLEGRRLSDQRRWIEESAPGEMEDLTDRIRLCIPISENERQSNPNIDLEHQDPVNPIYEGN